MSQESKTCVPEAGRNMLGRNVLRALLYFMGVMLVYTPTLPNRRIDAWLLWRDTEPLYNDRNKGSDFWP